MNPTVTGLLIPFLGTSLGAAMVFFLRDKIQRSVEMMLMGFAGGVMIAASIWSLLIPAINQAESMGKLSFIPAVVGFWAGILFLLLLDHFIPHLHNHANHPEGPQSHLKRSTMLLLAVTLHNIPEGMAVGVVYGGILAGNATITWAGALALSLGIAIQNIPEGAIISMPLKASGFNRPKAFFYGVLSGTVEPIAGALTFFASSMITPAMPFLLSFAAGAMIYVVIEELVPGTKSGDHSDIGTLFFAFGFSLMMILDVALG
ncbi:ZIP family metal transporter [Hallerella succinigenes]|uniref:ZIP family zinc transporter n=1 Tax=Hallerella succinigenes TaxID=1896222 RepID=A0A2M9A4W8_9BACT|nr:ZIP family metal transporter [Hallerella succinigenes]PJJ40761.1 ZIP family zinc transporter [Hallerella succinigenes]